MEPLPQVLSLDVLNPVNEVRKACGITEPAKSVQILFRGGHGLGVWDLEAHTPLAQWFSGGKRGGDMDGYFSTIGGRNVEVCTLGLGHLSEVVFSWEAFGWQFCWHGSGWLYSGYWRVRSEDMLELWQT